MTGTAGNYLTQHLRLTQQLWQGNPERRKGAARGWKKPQEGVPELENRKTPVHGAPHQLEGASESQGRGEYARMEVFIFSWPRTFNLKPAF